MGELAAAIELVIEPRFLDYLAAALLKTALAPVLGPPLNAGHLRTGPEAGLIHLFQAFPAGRCEGCGEGVKAVLTGVARCAEQAEFEALKAAGAAFRLRFQAGRAAKPIRMVIMVRNHLQPIFGGIAQAFVPS